MEIPHRELATTLAARLVVNNLMVKLGCKTTPKKELSEAIVPLFGIRWDIQVIRRVGAQSLRRLLWCLRNSSLSAGEYAKISQLFQEGLANKAEFPICGNSGER